MGHWTVSGPGTGIGLIQPVFFEAGGEGFRSSTGHAIQAPPAHRIN
jgi:hypothetical protein